MKIINLKTPITVKGPSRKTIPPPPQKVGCMDCIHYRPPKTESNDSNNKYRIGSCSLFYNYFLDEEVSIMEARTDNNLCGMSGFYFKSNVYR